MSHTPHITKKRRKMTSREGIQRIRLVLFGVHEPGAVSDRRFALAERFLTRRLESEGPWSILIELYSERVNKTRRMHRALGKTHEQLLNTSDGGFAAFITSLRALREYAHTSRGPELGELLSKADTTPQQRWAAFDHGLALLCDPHSEVRRAWEREANKKHSAPASTAMLEFKGEVAAYVHVMTIAGDAETAASAAVHDLCKKKAARLGLPDRKGESKRSSRQQPNRKGWFPGTPKAYYREVQGRLPALKNARGNLTIPVEALSDIPLSPDVSRCLEILRVCRAEHKRKMPLRECVKKLASGPFGPHLLPTRRSVSL